MKYFSKLSDKEKTQHIRLALGLAGAVCDDKAAEIVWRVFEGIDKKGGSFNLEDACKIEIKVKGQLTPKDITFEEENKNSQP
jgi:hypothetical protein